MSSLFGKEDGVFANDGAFTSDGAFVMERPFDKDAALTADFARKMRGSASCFESKKEEEA